MKKYIVRLTPAEQTQLSQVIRSGKAAARTLLHARILLKADSAPTTPVWGGEAISEALEVHATTVARVRQRFVEEGLEAALRPKPSTRRYERKLDGRDDPPHAKKNELQPHLKEYWAIPPEHSAEFVAAMEDVLELYQRPLDSAYPGDLYG